MKIRIFIKDFDPVVPSISFQKSSKNFLYLVAVLRVSIGDKVWFFNENSESLFLVHSTDKNSIMLKNTVDGIDFVKFSNEKLKNIAVIVPLVKPDKLILIAKQTVEIGVKFLCFVKMDRSSVGSFNEDRIISNMNEALEQSGGYSITELLYFKDLISACRHFEDWNIFYGRYHIENKLNIVKSSKTCVIVGPEGGFSESESVFLSKYNHISIGTRILRTETAATCMMTFADLVTI